MLDVLIALMPALVMSVLYFGYHVLINAVVCMGACFGFELLYTLVLKKDFSKQAVRSSSCWDCSCLVTGLILALNLPRVIIVDGWDLNVYRTMPTSGAVHAPDYVAFGGDTIIVCVLASLVAIVLVKMLFGGTGKNIVNPALAGRVFLFISFTLMTTAVACNFEAINGGGAVLETGATQLGGNILQGKESINLLDLFLGTGLATTAMGETCKIALLVGGIYLCGGLSNLEGIAEYLSRSTEIEVKVSAYGANAVIYGARLMLEDAFTK